jgi:hypothetical protein
MSNIKVFLGGYSLLNTLQQTTTLTLSKCAISTSSNKKADNNPKIKEQVESNHITVDYLKSKSIKFCQSWNNFNVYNCPKSNDSFFVNNLG